jgi:hypothetical protein
MDNELGMMDKFDFLLGNWKLEYRVPKSSFGESDTGSGEGTIKRALGGKYVYVDYRAVLKKSGKGAAHAIFGWDDRAKIYRYWWFEDSGNFLTASCHFVDNDTLSLNWHDTVLVQTFQKRGPNQVLLRMEQPISGGGREIIMEVLFTRKPRAILGATGEQPNEAIH